MSTRRMPHWLRFSLVLTGISTFAVALVLHPMILAGVLGVCCAGFFVFGIWVMTE